MASPMGGNSIAGSALSSLTMFQDMMFKQQLLQIDFALINARAEANQFAAAMPSMSGDKAAVRLLQQKIVQLQGLQNNLEQKKILIAQQQASTSAMAQAAQGSLGGQPAA
jgi:hypothetical protein